MVLLQAVRIPLGVLGNATGERVRTGFQKFLLLIKRTVAHFLVKNGQVSKAGCPVIKIAFIFNSITRSTEQR